MESTRVKISVPQPTIYVVSCHTRSSENDKNNCEFSLIFHKISKQTTKNKMISTLTFKEIYSSGTDEMSRNARITGHVVDQIPSVSYLLITYLLVYLLTCYMILLNNIGVV